MILQQPFAIPHLVHTYVRTLTIDHTQVPSTQTDFPILVNFTDATFKTVANGGHVNTTNAFTFSSDSGGSSLLKWEVERYNASSGEIVAWVKVASVSSSSDTVFYLRYGGAITTDQSDAANVWTSSFQTVLHVKDGSTLSVANSLGSPVPANNGATAGTGLIDGCAVMDAASNQYIGLNDSFNFSALTYSCWVNASALSNAYNATIFKNRVNVDFTGIMVKSTGKLYGATKATTLISYDGTGVTTLSTGTWYHLVMTYDSTNGLNVYVNASLDKNVAANGNAATHTAEVHVGDGVNSGNWDWTGSIDEPRIASAARTADWITVEYANQKATTNLVALGSET